jgi:hypothetical protein
MRQKYRAKYAVDAVNFTLQVESPYNITQHAVLCLTARPPSSQVVLLC